MHKPEERTPQKENGRSGLSGRYGQSGRGEKEIRNFFLGRGPLRPLCPYRPLRPFSYALFFFLCPIFLLIVFSAILDL